MVALNNYKLQQCATRLKESYRYSKFYVHKNVFYSGFIFYEM